MTILHLWKFNNYHIRRDLIILTVNRLLSWKKRFLCNYLGLILKNSIAHIIFLSIFPYYIKFPLTILIFDFTLSCTFLVTHGLTLHLTCQMQKRLHYQNSHILIDESGRWSRQSCHSHSGSAEGVVNAVTLTLVHLKEPSVLPLSLWLSLFPMLSCVNNVTIYYCLLPPCYNIPNNMHASIPK